eukprot:12675933-Alexandrium_andersonii.AAC.1
MLGRVACIWGRGAAGQCQTDVTVIGFAPLLLLRAPSVPSIRAAAPRLFSAPRAPHFVDGT